LRIIFFSLLFFHYKYNYDGQATKLEMMEFMAKQIRQNKTKTFLAQNNVRAEREAKLSGIK